jgi:hypothetical protein
MTGRESLSGRGPGDSAVVVETYFLQPCFRILEKRYESLFTDEHVRVRNQEDTFGGNGGKLLNLGREAA